MVELAVAAAVQAEAGVASLAFARTIGYAAVSGWTIAIILYASVALLTLSPAVLALVRPVRLNDGGPSFADADRLSASAQHRLDQNFQRIHGTLEFWKKRAVLYGRFHYYAAIWTLVGSLSVPVLAQAVPDTHSAAAKWLVTIVSAHAAITLALHRSLKVSQNYTAFRQGESDFYDLYRRLLDRPDSFAGTTEDERLSDYFLKVEQIRRLIRHAETDNLPTVTEAPPM